MCIRCRLSFHPGVSINIRRDLFEYATNLYSGAEGVSLCALWPKKT